MAIVSMQKMSLVAHSGERAKLLRIFIKSRAVELVKSENVTVTAADRETRERTEERKARAAFFLAFMKDATKELARYDKKQAPKINLKKENRLISLEEYEDVVGNTEDLNVKIDEVGAINDKITDLRSEKTRLSGFIDQLLPYKNLNFDMKDIHGTNTCEVLVGLIQTAKKSLFEEKIASECATEISIGDKTSAVVIVAHKSKKDEIKAVLNECDFTPCVFDINVKPSEKIAEAEKRIAEIDEEIKSSYLSTTDYLKFVPTMKIVYDYCSLELAKIEVTQNSTRTKKAIAFEGWVPAEKVRSLEREILDKCPATVVAFRDPLEEETPPTLTKNNKFVGAFSGITDMFGSPNYREKDPNLFVALFYFLIFGIMLGDAAYGLIMAIACFAFVKIKKPVKESGKMIIMFAFCGISTFIWGVLLGGWFGIELSEGSFLAKIRWFSPLDEPLKMFMLALGVGVLQLGTGFALAGASKIRSGKRNVVIKGILSDFGWVVIFMGLLCLFPNIMVYLNAIEGGKAWHSVMGKIGTYTALVGAAMIIVGGAWGKKNPIKMVGGALGSVYGAINIVSDLLSYSRLFGLGLTTGVIGLVMNKLGMIAVDIIGPAGWVVAVIIFVFGHVFNLAINLLGAYVHDSRLQYIEFFGKFYEGTGRAFKPLGNGLKYTYLDN